MIVDYTKKKYYIFIIMSLIKVCPDNIPDTQVKFGVDCMKLIFFLKKIYPPWFSWLTQT